MLISRYSKSGKKFFGCGNYPNCDYVAWSLAQARNPEKFADQIAAAEKRKLEGGTTKKVAAKKPVKKAAKKTTKKKTTKRKVTKKTAKV
jgi:DNA topoisomerase-1